MKPFWTARFMLQGLGSNGYLTMVLDRYDRKVIGWALSVARETVHTTIPAGEMVFTKRQAQAALIFHSDRGIPY
jgi:transposase InsO family protein